MLSSLLASFLVLQAPNYDESKVPDDPLPDPLVLVDGTPVADAGVWRARRRPELLRAFEREVYGAMPASSVPIMLDSFDRDAAALGGRATRRQLALKVGVSPETLGAAPRRIDVLVYTPNGVDGPVPAFLGLNFKGNHTVCADPAIRITRSWVPDEAAFDAKDHSAGAGGRGKRAGRWPVERILERGYAFATAYYGDIDPDHDDGFKNGVHPLFADGERDDTSWGSIGAWAWGLSRALDALECIPAIDIRHVAVIGHSRLGKTALWAGACDERFALVISNDSGCGGAALSRRRYGETVAAITRRFPHWFNARFAGFAGRESELSIDQHELIALIAPRPVYVASAVEDRWADPKGEFLAAKGAEPVYALFGKAGIGAAAFPAAGAAFGEGSIGYHLRPGGHDLTAWDWARYLDFADRHLRE